MLHVLFAHEINKSASMFVLTVQSICIETITRILFLDGSKIVRAETGRVIEWQVNGTKA